MTRTVLCFCAMLMLIDTAEAQRPIPFDELDVSVWKRRGASNGTGSGGEHNLIDPDKVNTTPTLPLIRTDLTDPSTWVLTGQSWQSDWQGKADALLTETGHELTDDPWIILDLGVSRNLEKMHIWNVSEATGWTRGCKTFNLYYASTPSAAIPGTAKSNALPGAATDYNFQSGGWTQFGSTNTVDRGSDDGLAIDLEIDFAGGVTSARYLGIEMKSNFQTPNSSAWSGYVGFNAFVITEIDVTPPGLDIADDSAGDTTEVYNPVTYTLSFTEDLDPSTIHTGVFSNVAGSPSAYLIDAFTQTDATTYELVVTPTTVGNFQLQVASTVSDIAGNPMASDVTDAETIAVTSDPTPPQVESIVDNRGGGPMGAGQTITYTITFNEHMDTSTVTTGDFANVSNTAVTVSAVTTGLVEDTVFVDVIPTEAGALQFRLLANSVVDKSGNTNDVAWTDDDIVDVAPSDSTDGTWAVNADGDWQEVSNWESNVVARGTDRLATFPNNISANRTVTLTEDVTIGHISFEDGGSHLEIAGAKTLTLDTSSGTPTIDVDDEELTITAIIAGDDGLSKVGAGYLRLNAANTFTGDIDLSAGRLQIRSSYDPASFGNVSNVIVFSSDAELQNVAGNYAIAQGMLISSGVTARITGASGRDTYIEGELAGTGNVHVDGTSNGFEVEFRNTSNTFTGPIVARRVALRMRSLLDSPSPTSFGLESQSDDGAQFQYLSGALTPLILNNRQFELIEDGSAGTNLDRQPGVDNNASGTNTVTINTDLLVTGTGMKRFILGGSNTNANSFAGAIQDAVDADVLHLYKDGAGTWQLSGINTYEGDTTIINGTLAVQGEQCLPDDGTLHIENTSGRKLRLDSREKVGALTLNGVPQSDGTYGATGSGAATENDAYFSGSEILYVGEDFPPSGTVLVIH